jgi:hypothetical protein
MSLVKLPQSPRGFDCPKCNLIVSYGYDKPGQRHSIRYSTPHEFKHYPDPHYSWVEIHHCPNCRTTFWLKNST